MKIVLITALWEREHISELFFMWHKHVQNALTPLEIDLQVLAVVSRDEDAEICARHAINCVHEENSPLGRKFNKLTESVPSFYPDYDAILILGSDDFITPDYISHAAHIIREGGEYVSARTATMLDAYTGRVVRFKGNVTIGGGRMVRRELIEACGNRPWHDEMEDGLDKSFDYHLRLHELYRKAPIRFALCDEGTLLAIKQTKTQIWTFDFLCKRTMWEPVTDDEFRKLRKEFEFLFDNMKYNGLDCSM